MKKMFTWQEGLIRLLNNKDLKKKKVMRFRLPRQIGTTTFLTDFANEEVANGKKVLFIAHKSSAIRKDLLGTGVVGIGYNQASLRGLTQYDWVIGDCLFLNKVERKAMKLLGKRVLLIDTTEG